MASKTCLDGKQHFIPKFLLKFFAHDKEQIAVYDKKRSNVRTNNIRDICAHKNFYNSDFTENLAKKLNPDNFEALKEFAGIDSFDELKLRLSIEQQLQKIENPMPAIYKKIIQREGLFGLNNEEYVNLIEFIIHLDKRSAVQRENMLETSRALKGVVEKMCKTNPNITLDNKSACMIDPEFVKFTHMHHILDIEEHLIYAVSQMSWLLFKAPQGHEFFISDRAILRFNATGGGINGYLVPNVEIYVPISSMYFLVIFQVNMVQHYPGREKIKCSVSNRILEFIDNQYNEVEKIELVRGAISRKKPIISYSALRHINSLQLVNANYIFCKHREYLARWVNEVIG
jgi:hypothetical protein